MVGYYNFANDVCVLLIYIHMIFSNIFSPEIKLFKSAIDVLVDKKENYRKKKMFEKKLRTPTLTIFLF